MPVHSRVNTGGEGGPRCGGGLAQRHIGVEMQELRVA